MKTNPIEEYCRKQGYRLAEEIDAKMALVIKPRPLWCPEWLYRKIIKQSVEIIKII